MRSTGQSLERLRADRQSWVDANRKNGFEAGILRLLTQLYPDNAHFIYELLQNAEDAGASHVRFRLSKHSLVFEHNGPRLFSERDVKSITSIGDSTKLDSPTQIGKFGVGFKAVFAYTQTPQIHSGEFHFRIRDLVVPESLPSLQLGSDGFRTRFVFPFDHPQKPAEQAESEIARALCALDDATLLFLSHISRISYSLRNGREGQLERLVPPELQRADSPGEQIQVSVHDPSNGSRISHWLRYQGLVAVNGGTERKDCMVAVAFGLEESAGKGKNVRRKIFPLSPGRVSIYFPAEKETSNLRFHIHAPFASTVARDSIRDSDGNRELLAAIAELAASSLEDIRDRGLLTVSALDVLPIEEDNLSSFYEPVRERLVEEFLLNDLVPTKSGGHRKAENLFRGPSDIVNLISDEDLATITGDKWAIPLWCANPPQVNQRADKFLEALEIEDWGWEELSASLSCDRTDLILAEDPERPDRLTNWLNAKDDTWLKQFYTLLHDATDRHCTLDISGWPFVRVDGTVGTFLIEPEQAFFPPTVERLTRDDIRFVRSETYSSGKSAQEKSKARLFLESAGVRVFDEESELALILDRYEDDSFPHIEEHLEHIKRFVAFYTASPHKTDVFSHKRIFLGQEVGSSDDPTWCRAGRLILDAPFGDPGLSATEGARGKRLLWGGYSKFGAIEVFINFAKALGVQSGLRIIKVSTAANEAQKTLRKDYYQSNARWTDSATDDDWTIEGIESLVRKPTMESSKLVWKALTSAEPRVAKARFRPNQQHLVRENDSQLVCWLKNNAWIPDVDGNFHKPQDIGLDQLRPGFDYDDRNGLLTAVGFGEAIRRQTDEYKQKEAFAREYGFPDPSDIGKIKNAMDDMGLDASALIALVKQKGSKPEQPKEQVQNPERRRRGVLERRANAPEREAVQRERSIQSNVPDVVAEAKAYLRAKYTNSDGQMICQACQAEMPFKLGNGEYYFEAVQIIRGLGQHFYENRLALCPTCAAMYQYARKCPDDDLRRRISNADLEEGSSVAHVEVILAGKRHFLHFVGTHFFDLKLVMDGEFVAGSR